MKESRRASGKVFGFQCGSVIPMETASGLEMRPGKASAFGMKNQTERVIVTYSPISIGMATRLHLDLMCPSASEFQKGIAIQKNSASPMECPMRLSMASQLEMEMTSALATEFESALRTPSGRANASRTASA